MAYDFKDKVALVTGASRGIGRAIAFALAQGGAKVVLNYTRNAQAAEDAAELIRTHGGEATTMGFDVADAAAVDAAIKEIVDGQGGLHVLVNNAGVSIDGLLLRLKEEDWERTLAVNLSGTMHTCRAAAKQMMRQRAGAIVNLTSVVGETGNPGQGAYSASKGGIIAFTKSLARELASRNIRVNAVAPGFVETDMTGALPEAARTKMIENVPMARQARPEEIARAVAWLASDEASYVTGTVLNVNGGMYM